MRIFLYLLFAYAGIVSGARTGVVMGLVAIPAYFIFKSQILTMASYITGICSFIFIVSISNYVVESKILSKWTDAIVAIVPESMGLNLQLGTLTIRFIGFSQWSKLDFWKPFGHSFSDPDYYLTFPSHDMFTGIMLRFGYVPVVIFLIVGGYLMYKFHKNICRKGIYHQNLYLSLAIIACILFGCLTVSNLSTYPVNLMLYLFIGFAIVSARSSVDDIETARLEEQEKRIDDQVSNNNSFGYDHRK